MRAILETKTHALLRCLFLSAAVCGWSCTGEPPATPAEVHAVLHDAVPVAPDDPAWEDVPLFPAELILQDLVEPRLLTPSTTQVGVRAVSDGRQIAFRLEWVDATLDDLPHAALFSDACAVQLPVEKGPDLPAPQMGEAGRAVEIAYWRASWQAAVDGRGDEIQDLYPGATVDHYPFQAQSLESGSEDQRAMELRYAPARALDNRMEGPRERPVQDLLAEGPGTLVPLPVQVSSGKGVRTEDGWRVVIVRPLPSWLQPGMRSQVAFAVWDGAHEEVGSRKMRSVWIPLSVGASS